MLLTLPDELILNITNFMIKTKDHLNLRSCNKYLYNLYSKIPFYKDKKHLGYIYITPSLISWRCLKKENKLLKEIIFGSYGKINVNNYSKIFSSKDRVVYDLPNTIKKINYENRAIITKTFDLKKDKLDSKIIPIVPGHCIIS